MSDRSINEVYYETVRPPVYFQYFLYAVIGLLGYLTVSDMADMPPTVGVFGLIIVYVISSIFGTMTIRITKSTLTVGFGFIKHRIELNNIDKVEVRRYPWWKYGGFGIRFGLDWSVGYIQNYKQGILIVPISGRKLFFSTNRAEIIEQTLGEMIQIR